MDADDRIIKEVIPPPRKPVSMLDMLMDGCLPDWRLIKSHLAAGGYVSRTAAIYLISQCKFLFQKEPAVLELTDPVSIIGDIHGQFYDLLYILDHCSFQSENLLFLGDYVDRGKFSTEVILLLFSLKLNFPKQLLMIRGNHESRHMTSHFSFRREMIHKYDLEVYEMIMETFDCMPLACVVNNEIFAVHGGISPLLHSLNDIQSLDRFVEPPDKGLLCDLLWADPEDDENKNSKFSENKSRGCSFRFGLKAVKSFLKSNKLKTVIRAHQVQPEGFKFHSWVENSGKIPVITVFSAANYCETVGNRGAFISVNDSVIKVKQFLPNPQPFDLPGGMDAFTWSVPFVIDQVVSFFKRALRTSGENSPASPQLACSFKDLEQELIEKIPELTETSKVSQETAKNLKIEDFKQKTVENTETIEKLEEIKAREKKTFKKFLTDEDLFIINEKLNKFLNIIHDEYKVESHPNSKSSTEA